MAELKGEKPLGKKTKIFRTNIFLYGILLGLMMMLGIFLGSRNPLINHYMTLNTKKQEIFKYLEQIQSLEEKMYPISKESINWIHRYSKGKDGDLDSLDQNMMVIDELMMMSINIPASSQVMESHILFMEELKMIKSAMIEMEFAQNHDDARSIEKAQVYLKEFQTTANERRIALKTMMEQYKIPYIDLGDRIKYRTK
ncbi:hypothetical protein HNQ80_005153 [Anaerosolibacter carboniphilus]|uniref:Uncharacterized protein n=1 Tax=Anaerosolibacter carboniphilus TaxID=1417629 RepID=A0A841L9Q7_9FIRM|nr:hypothetical protein [Anaerosolibacter carboniphilus]MBB6218975.1 hypothetical protein [Anaerosolibacter carboniphilus]